MRETSLKSVKYDVLLMSMVNQASGCSYMDVLAFCRQTTLTQHVLSCRWLYWTQGSMLCMWHGAGLGFCDAGQTFVGGLGPGRVKVG